MLTITPNASTAIRTLLTAPSVPEGSGVRLMQGPTQGGGVGLGLAVVEQPGPADQVIEAEGGADLFLEPETAELLDDKELDANVEGNQVTFSLRPQAPTAS
jgi:Fe-S cluster assembly iron-binding protein IscA